jgi:hypothetical protein
VQSVFHNWISRLAWVIENGGRILLKKYEMVSLLVVKLKIGEGPETFLTPCRVVQYSRIKPTA